MGEFNNNHILNAIMSNVLIERVKLNYPYHWQWAFHYMYDWLQVNDPNKTPILRGELCFDFDDSYSFERENIFLAIEWIAEHRKRFLEFGVPYSEKTIHSSICRQFGLTYDPTDIAPGHEPPQRPLPPDDEFDFESYIRSEVINHYGIVTYIASLEVFRIASEGDNRRNKLCNDMIKQDFSRTKLLSLDEQKWFAGGLATLAEMYNGETDIQRKCRPKELRVNWAKSWLGIKPPPILRVIKS